MNGIEILQFRGYDSCGICTVEDEKLKVTKMASDQGDTTQGNCIENLIKKVEETHKESSVGIGHTRWATHGQKSDKNAHPHVDSTGRISIVHNGIIDNFKEMREILLKEGVSLQSETDTEVIVQLISLNYKKLNNFKDAIKFTLENQIVGTYALAIMNLDEPGSLYCVKNGSPLLVGKGDNFFIVSSDASAFKNYTDQYFNIDNRDVVELTLNMKLNHLEILTSKPDEVLKTPKEGFDHFMIQEIFEQPETINRAMNNGGRVRQCGKNNNMVKLGGLEANQEMLKVGENLMILGCGTSYFAASFVANLARKLDIFNTVQVIDASGFNTSMIPKEKPVAIIVSQSGESYDVIRAFEKIKSAGVLTLGIINKVESTLGRAAFCGVFINAGREISVASTKAFSGQVVAISLAILFFAQIKKESYLIISQFPQSCL